MSQNSHYGIFISRTENYITTVLKICQAIGMAFIIAMIFLTVAHSIGRYVFDRPIPGLVEMSKFMLVTAVFMGGAYTALIKGHITIGLVVDHFSRRTQAIVDSITYFLCLVLAILALWQSFVQGMYIMKAGVEYTILGIPYFPFVYIVGVGWGLFCVAIVIHLVRFLYEVVRR